MFGFVALLGALLVGVLVPTASLPALQGSNDIEATVAALENRVTGLEARMTVIEKRVAGQGAQAPEGAASGGATYTLRGSFTVYVGGSKRDHPKGQPCTSGREGITAGARITIYDGRGQVLATTEVQTGEIQHDLPITGETDEEYAFPVCVLPFEVGLPNSDFYEFTAEGMGGSLTYSRAELEEQGWVLKLRWT
jgi:hypothetical protein